MSHLDRGEGRKPASGLYRSRLEQEAEAPPKRRTSELLRRYRARLGALSNTEACCELDSLRNAGLVAIRWGFAQYVEGMWTVFPFA